MKNEYRLHNGAQLAFKNLREEPSYVEDSHPKSAILVRREGFVSQQLADRAASRMVGVRANVSQRYVTLYCERIKDADDALEVASEFVYQLDLILRKRDIELARRKTAKKEARSNKVIKRTPRP